MEVTRLSSKGQITIPKAIRDGHHWQAGTVFVIEESAAGIFLRPDKLFPLSAVEDGIGCAGYKGPPKTFDEMEEGIA